MSPGYEHFWHRLSNTCSSVHQRKPQTEDIKAPTQIPSQNSRRWAKSWRIQHCSRPGRTRFLWTATGPHAGLFSASKSFSAPTATFSPSDTFFLPVCFPQGVPATWSRAGFVGSCPWSCGQLSPCPRLLQQMLPRQVWCSHPHLPKAENKSSRRSRGCQLGGGCEVSKPLLDIELSWQICLPL